MLTAILADDKKQGSSLHCEDFYFYMGIPIIKLQNTIISES
ncbi:hypothetical protein BCAH187_C0266 (plasmid) [Bacillus cereus AH187]|uniref:Uncharacterized protein n=1 Tax=Bacillus cereus (strain AH187) TaxID=405534 RepID=B7I0W2_BACC7|nr:hypothetical protein BCAH187_C0266 [Bacillus cereus AH187]